MVAASLTLVALTSMGQVVALRSDKPAVTSQESARIEIRTLDGSGQPLQEAQVSLTVNVGSVTEPVPTQAGTFTATYRPPTEEGAQVALFHATLKHGASRSGAWLSLPVRAPHVLRVQAPPRARVRVSIGAASFGPVTASPRGEASVPVELSPGASSAQVTTVDRSGRTRTQTLPLPAPRFARIRLVALEPPVQEQPVQLQGFVVDESGNPAVALPAITVSSDQGTLGPIEPKEDGVFEIPYTAARSEGPVSLSASPLEDTDRSSTLQLTPLPAPLAWPSAVRPSGSAGAAALASQDGRSPWQPSAGVFLFAQTNTAASNGFGIRGDVALRLAGLPLEALLQLEGRQNQDETEILAPQGGVEVTRTFSLGGFGGRLGARWSQPFLSRGVLFADVTAGLLWMRGRLLLKDADGEIEQELSSVGPMFAAGGGLGWALGPGRLCGQLQWAHAPGHGQVRGNLGGLSVGLGYQFLFAGSQDP